MAVLDLSDDPVTSTYGVFTGTVAPQIDGEVALVVLGGSRAYGTDHEGSDVDLRGCFIAPPARLLDGRPVPGQHTSKLLDVVVYELGKLVSLACAGNPNVLEILYSPHVLHASDAGRVLLEGRDLLLNRSAYEAYRGFANSQLRRLERTGGPEDADKRRKYLLHVRRLLDAGITLMETGTVVVEHPDPERLQAFAALSDTDAVAAADKLIGQLDQAAERCVLPAEVDRDAVASLIGEVRCAARPELRAVFTGAA